MTRLNIQLGKRIRLLRHKKKLTQEELGEKSGISWKFIGEIERGRANPSVAVLEKISNSLNLILAELLDLEDRYPAQEVLLKTQRLKEELVDYLGKLSLYEQEKAIKILKIIFDKDDDIKE